MSKLNKEIVITFPDGGKRPVSKGTTGSVLAQSISSRLAREALAMEVDGVVWDLAHPLVADAVVTFLTWDTPGGKQVFWHSSAHLLAEALEALYPGVKLGIGPAIEQGFYYDVDFGDHSFDGTHLAKIEKKVTQLVQEKHSYQRMEISKEKASVHFKKKKNKYKLELIEELEDGNITFYSQGDFVDLCKGPHLPSTSLVKAFKLLAVAGAYWRGDVTRPQLVRIYGISFPKQQLLKEYLTLREEAKKRDHRTIGKALGFFTFSEEVGAGLPLWLPKGAFVREQLVQFLRRAQEKAGYLQVVTPHIGHKALYVRSGHYEKYKKDTFQAIKTPHEEEVFLLKPMNCPHHCVIYKCAPRSYRELPLRLAEFGTVYRYEQSGELHGLTRVRGFTQDDAHIFCRPDQVKAEFTKVVDLVHRVLKTFNFKAYEVQISLRDPQKPEKYIGSDALWVTAEQAIQEVVAAKGIDAQVVPGEAAFYGPKLDFIVRDGLGRRWQLGTVQIDYQLPERFDLSYVGADNANHRPVMIHRAPFGSLERFIALLLEHTAGKLPLWLVPEQVIVLPISTLYVAYAHEVVTQLEAAGLRAKVDLRDEKVGRKIRDAEISKIPYMLLVGEQEVDAKEVAVRKQGSGDRGRFTVVDFIASLKTDLRPE